MQMKDATILVVDDEVVLLNIFMRWIEREGARVFTARNGVEALQLLEANPVDMIISDVRMPKMDGIELARRVRKIGRYFPKIIFVSGFGNIDERECCDLGIEFKLAKPIRRDSLVSTVQMCLTSRDQLWRGPPELTAERTLDVDFQSLREAEDRGLIGFGYGGICVHSAPFVHDGETIGLNVRFAADHHAIAGQGVVRWTAADEQQFGIMISYVDDRNRAWLVDLPERKRAVSFIPRSTELVASNPSRPETPGRRREAD
jgi:CheY-like chemotaxis protein